MSIAVGPGVLVRGACALLCASLLVIGCSSGKPHYGGKTVAVTLELMPRASAGAAALTEGGQEASVDAWVLNLKGWTTSDAKQDVARFEARRLKFPDDPGQWQAISLRLRRALDKHALARVQGGRSTHTLPTGQLFLIADHDGQWVWKEFNPATDRTVRLDF